jgi:Domain of unknown function (DUF4349)
MRLNDMRDDAPLPAEIEAELDALDAALRGEEVPPGMEGVDTLVSDLRAERPEPDPEFGDALDAWAAAGFTRPARRGRLRNVANRPDVAGQAHTFLRSLTLRKLAPVGAAAATLVVIVVGVAQIDFTTSGRDGDDSGGGGDSAVSAAEDASVPERGGAEPLSGAPAEATEALDEQLDRGAVRATRAPIPNGKSSGPAAGQDVRRVERDAQLTLTAPSDEVQDVTNDAIGVVEAQDGIVLSSRTRGTDDSASAVLDLVIPTRNLDATLDELSDLADVKSLSEGSVDITRPFIDARDALRGLEAERRSLLRQIRAADTEEELDRLRARLEVLDRRISFANAEFENIQRRARHSNVTVQITSNGSSEGDWSLDDALDDAGRVLTVAAGVALISAAVLLPLALIAAILYFVLSASRNRARERALDE